MNIVPEWTTGFERLTYIFIYTLMHKRSNFYLVLWDDTQQGLLDIFYQGLTIISYPNVSKEDWSRSDLISTSTSIPKKHFLSSKCGGQPPPSPPPCCRQWWHNSKKKILEFSIKGQVGGSGGGQCQIWPTTPLKRWKKVGLKWLILT